MRRAIAPGTGVFAALALGCLLALALGELVARALGRSPAEGPTLVCYDPLLGWVPRPSYRSPRGASWPVYVEPDGLRSNGGARPAGHPILAVGDSYTFGDEVADDQSWPASLERHLGVPVLNGGVSAYGFDQTVLRAERLVEARPVRALVVSLIRDDLRRCQLSAFCGWRKPYFELEGEDLRPRNVPVTRALFSRPALERLLPWSALLNWMRQASAPGDQAAHRSGTAVAERLLDRLGARARQGLPVLLVLQGPMAAGRPARFEARTLPVVRELDEAARAAGLATLDLVSAAWAEVKRRPALRAEWYLRGGEGHMSPAGNAWVAARIAARLRELGWLAAERR